MRKIGVAVLGVIMLVAFAGVAQAEIKIGVLAKSGSEIALSKWKATGDYLAVKLGEPVVVIPLKFTAIEPIVKSGKIDFLLANSAFFVEMEKKYGTKAVATLINSVDGKALKEFGAVVLVRADSPIHTLTDIKGKKFMCVKFNAFGGLQMAWRLFLENGIDPQKDFAVFAEGNKHDNVVMAVKSGVMDAGTVRTDTLERMADQGKINMADFRVINEIKDDFPYVRSTILYPEWPMAALSHVDADKAAKVGAALQALTPGDPAAKNAQLVGWAPAADYGPVRDCLKAIKYGAFAN
ncbi:MAG: phosphate/phosphite/phosphonate ABC transporter substrate-binding protein [Proteobacteria bacterium]|nr:phosphate/phosphite/phosphonate ABC transporter substrate-binding protein [Pseudomonadota bacterium]MBU1639385.1 phosphate/phosphite/phosphonate ABC transporter substrate-binding protein [Pseudomonadota bacterium]